MDSAELSFDFGGLGTAMGCRDQAGQATIDLSNTPFALAESVVFEEGGADVVSQVTFNIARTRVELSVSGECGWLVPQGELIVTYRQ